AGGLRAAGGGDGRVALWDPVRGQPLGTWPAHANWITAVAFAPDPSTLATASADNTVKLWDPTTRQERATLRGHTREVKCVAFAPDGRVLGPGGVDATTQPRG